MTATSTLTSELSYWIALNAIDSVGSATFFKILAQYPKVSELFLASSHALKRLRLKDNIISDILNGPNLEYANREISMAEEYGISIITFNSDDYPLNLKNSPYAPPLIYVKGTLIREDTYALAMVGTRRSTQYGAAAAEFITQGVATQGITVVSGLAQGIDRACHQQCINMNKRTIAVLGQGILDLYLGHSKKIIDDIAQCGAIISQFPLNYPGSTTTFPIRNKVISGLSKATLVIESSSRGGALITARNCIDEGKELMAVPGNIFSVASQGCNTLIAQGAHPIYHPDQVVQIIERNPFQSHRNDNSPFKPIAEPLVNEYPQPKPAAPIILNKDEQALIELMPPDKIHVDTLSDKSGLPASQVLSILTLLELKTYVASCANMFYQKLI
ncbi:MAG: DNA-processing protein DprA [Fibrobacterales bacterium]